MNRFVRHATLMAAMAAFGCRANKSSAPPPSLPTSQPAPYTTTDTSLPAAQQRSSELSQVVQQLPGRTPEDDRRLVVAAFDRASAALQQLAGPNPPGTLRVALRIIDNSREQLSRLPANASPDARIDTGLRALSNALNDIRAMSFTGDADMQRLMNELVARINELDTVRGPLHSIVVAHAFAAASDVLMKMSGQSVPPMATQP